MISNLQQLKTFMQALSQLRYWDVPASLGGKAGHVTIMAATAEEALARAPALCKRHGLTVDAKAVCTENPKLAKPAKPSPSPAAPADAPAQPAPAVHDAPAQAAPAAHATPATPAHDAPAAPAPEPAHAVTPPAADPHKGP